ncbi:MULTISPECIES: hypothetical protein [unclassified Mesorhizobium]|uniref:hypothetical protein n=1 Tax=unclassified Mesorhizobium TaxID=325217 RepID=UPI001FE08B0B|nr:MULTISPECIES: hypothetical protein [unclassified Mesorhizobium]
MQPSSLLNRPFLKKFDRVHDATYASSAEELVIDENGTRKRVSTLVSGCADIPF